MRVRGSLILLVASTAVVAQTAKPAAIPGHTAVEIQLGESISSETLRAGQEIAFTVVRPVVVDGTTVIAAGTPLVGEVKSAQSAGAFRKTGSFDLGLKPLNLPDGTTVQLDFPRPKLRGARGEKAATSAAAVPVLLYYFPLIPFAVAANAKKGAAYKVAAGERYLVYVVPAAPAAQEPASAAPPSAGETKAQATPSPPQ